MKTIEIIVTPTGKTSIQTIGFVGPACREASEYLENALGARVSEQKTVEFHQSQAVEQSQRLRQ
jgi:hypothetical protein